MSSLNRRDFLRLAAGASAVLANSVANGQAVAESGPAASLVTNLPRFVDPLPLLRKLAPYRRAKGVRSYRVRMMEATHRMHSALPPARVWGYEGQYPGPVLEAFRGERVEITWENQLPAKHLFGVDPHIHGAMPPAPAVRTVPHLHGSRTSSESDGLPEKWFTPGKSVKYVYPNDQRAATLWYHDHAVGITRLNVYAGLSGFYLLRDEEEQRQDLPSGEYEIPLMLQDRTLDDAGQLVYAPTHDDGLKLPDGVWGPEFLGRLPVINGAVFPYLEVEPRPYRLRILNGSNSRFFGLRFNLAKRATDIPDLVTFHQIGTDGGLLAQPAELNGILLGSAERADVIVDFSRLAGKTVTLMNDAAAPYPGWGMLAMHAAQIFELMQFRVTRPVNGTARPFRPQQASFARLEEKDVKASRDLLLTERIDAQGHSLGVRINEKGYDDPVTEIVKFGTVEKWRFINTTEDAHPMHLHLVQFQILHRQGLDLIAFQKGAVQGRGSLRPPAAYEAGWKDTAVVMPNEMLTVLARFDGFKGKYVFHCHMLEHEDNDMMRPFEVV